MGAMVSAGILTDLTPYANEYGWFDVISPSLVARNSFTADGTEMGEGNLYGMPITAEFVGVFYNKEKFAAVGAEVPTTFAEFEAQLQQLKDAGEIPIAFGNLDAWPAIHTFSEIQNLYVDGAYLEDFIYGRGNVGFDVPASEQAAAKLQEWVDAGYFTPDFSGINYDDSWPAFANGEGATMITGSWVSGEIPAVGDPANFGFFLTPPETAGAAKPSVAGTSMAYAIRNGTPNADLAAEYINWLLSDRATELWIGTGVVPLRVDSSRVEPGTLYGDVVAAWVQLNDNDLVGHYLDWATPTFYDTLTASLQELLGGAVSPEQFVEQVQADYAAYLAEKSG
jgi:raffinose/stachyose/melibiose transport system substrate-binding protein